jgi:hypothetical protein
MKRIFLLLLSISLSVIAFSNDLSKVFEIDEDRLATELSALSLVEEVVKRNSYTRTDLFSAENPIALNALQPTYGIESVLLSDDGTPLGIPSFFWGFCFGILGILLVYIITEDQSEARKAVNGCAVMGLLYGLFYVAFLLIMINAPAP